MVSTCRRSASLISGSYVERGVRCPNQFDQDVLPPYEILDSILEGLVEREESVASLSKRFPSETVQWVVRQLDRNEFKRRQMPPGIKLSQRAFGSGRRMPIAARIETF